MNTPPVLEEFVAACRAAVDAGSDVSQTIAGLMRELVSEPATLAAAVPAFADDEVDTTPSGYRLGGEAVLHQTPDLTVMVLDTLPGVVQPAHDHAMNAFIGVFEGCEEQRFWTRTSDGVEATTGRLLEAGEMVALGERAIHAISSPEGQAARAVHVYLGDIYAVERSVFEPDTMTEHPMTSDRYDEFCRPA
jgi:predicted metal-dependent enzyme (double-stranded beta helix superfamily)